MPDSLFVALQHLVPQRALTVFAGWVARAQWGALTQRIIRRFIARYGVNMAEAAHSDPAHYTSFNAFFTRALRADARPLAVADFVCPVDGAVSQLGHIEHDKIFQAKGHHYTTKALLAGSSKLAALFQDGQFATIYLSPKDYHRIHMPSGARLRRMLHVPGSLFSVNPATAAGVQGLFARNERVVCEFELPPASPGAEPRPFALVLVGATLVGSMATTWHGVVNPPRTRSVRQWRYENRAIELKQGDEMGHFMLGSTVVLLWPKNTIALNPQWTAGQTVRMGEAMGSAV